MLYQIQMYLMVVIQIHQSMSNGWIMSLIKLVRDFDFKIFISDLNLLLPEQNLE